MPTRNFRELVDGLSPARRKRIGERVREGTATLPLGDLRKAREMSQLQMGEILGVHQSEISRIEHRKDICISTLIEYVEALGGRLEMRAVFPDREVRISQFEPVDR